MNYKANKIEDYGDPPGKKSMPSWNSSGVMALSTEALMAVLSLPLVAEYPFKKGGSVIVEDDTGNDVNVNVNDGNSGLMPNNNKNKNKNKNKNVHVTNEDYNSNNGEGGVSHDGMAAGAGQFGMAGEEKTGYHCGVNVVASGSSRGGTVKEFGGSNTVHEFKQSGADGAGGRVSTVCGDGAANGVDNGTAVGAGQFGLSGEVKAGYHRGFNIVANGSSRGGTVKEFGDSKRELKEGGDRGQAKIGGSASGVDDSTAVGAGQFGLGGVKEDSQPEFKEGPSDLNAGVDGMFRIKACVNGEPKSSWMNDVFCALAYKLPFIATSNVPTTDPSNDITQTGGTRNEGKGGKKSSSVRPSCNSSLILRLITVCILPLLIGLSCTTSVEGEVAAATTGIAPDFIQDTITSNDELNNDQFDNEAATDQYQMSENVIHDTDNKLPSTFAASKEQLEEIQYSLRGRDSEDVDSVGILTSVKDMMKAFLGSIQDIQNHYHSGDTEKVAATLKTITGDTMEETGNKAKLSNNIGLSKSFDGVVLAGAPLTLEDIPNDQLAEFLEPQKRTFNQLSEQTEDLVQFLEDVHPIILAASARSERYYSQQQSTRGDNFNFESNRFGFRVGKSQFHQSSETFWQHIQNGAKGGSGSFRTKLGSFFEKDEIIMAKHQLRQEALGGAVCTETCQELEEWMCNCKNLFECVNEMSEYDLAVLIAEGYIDRDPESETFGNFTLASSGLNLFDFDDGVKVKLRRIRNTALDYTNIDQCKDVLNELFTACDPSQATCSDPNSESFQVSTEKVCSAINTPTKLLIEVIGEEFDNFVDDSSADVKCEPLSYDVCAKFASEFDRFYKARPLSAFPDANPMRRQSMTDSEYLFEYETVKEIFQHIRFPYDYWFPRNEKGIVDRTDWSVQYGPYDYWTHNDFPGNMQIVNGAYRGEQCLSSTQDVNIAKRAMHYCDKSMSDLLGSQTSLGTFLAISALVTEKGAEHLPGKCCFDTPTTNDEYFGFEFDPEFMTCQNTGPWHLGISEGACKNAGGNWFRSPCVTLKDTIDSRPPKFDLDAPMDGNYEEMSGELSVAYVKTLVDHAEFTHSSDEHGCNQFCRSLPDYSKQVAMMTTFTTLAVQVDAWDDPNGSTPGIYFTFDRFEWEDVFGSFSGGMVVYVHQWREGQLIWSGRVTVYEGVEFNGTSTPVRGSKEQNSIEGDFQNGDKLEPPRAATSTARPVESCVCLYPNGMVPAADLLPDHATSTPPKIFLTTPSDKMALGMTSGYDCSADEISIFGQDYKGTTRQQFQFTHQHQLVSVACPGKALTADCSTGMVTLVDSSFIDMPLVRKVRIELKGDNRILSMAEVEVYDETGTNVAFRKPAKQSSTNNYEGHDHGASEGADGINTGGTNDFTLTKSETDPWWEVDLETNVVVQEVRIFNRDASTSTRSRLSGAVVTLLYANGGVVASHNIGTVTNELQFIISRSHFGLGDTTDSRPTKQAQQWIVEGDIISNAQCPSLQLSSNKDSTRSLDSFYFAISNPATGMVMGIEGDACVEGVDITLQKPETGTPKQQFYMNGNKIVSLLCPTLVVAENLEASSVPSMMPTAISNASAPSPSSSYEGDVCLQKNLQLKYEGTSDGSEWVFNDDNSIESSVECKGKVVSVATGGKLSAKEGAALILTDHGGDKFTMYKRWAKSNQALSIKSGPFSFIHPTTGFAFGVEDSECAIGMTLKAQNNDHTSPNQQFYIGSAGVIFSSKCHGLVITLEGDDCTNGQLSLGTATGKDNTKWILNGNGSIESTKCPGYSTITGTSNIILHHEHTNIALHSLGARASGSNTWNDYHSPSKAIDGNPDTYTKTKYWPENDWWKVDLQQEYPIQRIVIVPNESLNVNTYVQLLDANEIVVHEMFFDHTVTGEESFEFDGIASQYVKIGNDQNGSFSLQLKQVEVYAQITKWNQVNTQLLIANGVNEEGWNQHWNVEFEQTHSGGFPSYDTGKISFNTCFLPSLAFSASFEDFAKEITIEDESNEDQCRDAREKLGYGRDHPFDTEVCDTFNDYACSIEFTGVDHMAEAEGLSAPPEFVEVEFEAPEYPDDPDLSFEELPEHNFEMPELNQDPERAAAYNAFAHLERSKNTAASFKEIGAGIYTNAKDVMTLVCLSVPIFAAGVCVAVANAILIGLWVLKEGAALANEILAHTIFEMQNFSADDVDTNHAAVATLRNLATFDTYVQDALGTINRNIFTQHSEMREHLQDRHQVMTNDIVEFLEESTNAVSGYFELQTDWLHDNLCAIYKEVANVDDCDGTKDTLLGLIGLSLWEKMMQIEEQGKVVAEKVQVALSLGVEGKTQGLLRVETDMNDLESIHAKIEAKMGIMEEKMNVVEANIQGMKDNMVVLEDKMDSRMDAMENKMDTIEGMLSKMMDMLSKEKN